jgi:hypothetical protein
MAIPGRRGSSLLAIMVAVMAATSLVGIGQADAATIMLSPSFSAADLGEGATLTTKLTISGSEYHGSPAPLKDFVVHLPAGTGLVKEGFAECSWLTLEASGPSGCPPGSQAGPVGETVFEEAKQGGGRIVETGTVQAFFALPEEEQRWKGSEYFLYFSGPGTDYFIATARLSEDSSPYGHLLNVELPFIVTIPGEPYLSWNSITLKLGATLEEAGQLVSSLTIPEECPVSGKFPWAVDVTLEETIHQSATAETTCPPASSKRGTTTTVAASTVSPVVGGSVTYTATVTPKTAGVSEPSGTIRFFDGGSSITGCSAQSLMPGSSSSTAICTLNYSAVGSHQISARYAGDSNFFGSVSTAQTITVSAAIQPPNKQHEEEAALKKKAEEEALAAQRKHEAEAVAKKAEEEKVLVAVQSALAGIVAPSSKAAKIGSLLKNGGLSINFTAAESGTLLIQWWQVPSGAHLSKTKAKAKPILVAQGKMMFTSAASSKVKIGLTGVGRRLLGHAKRLALSEKVEFVPTAGAVISMTKVIVVRR